MTGLEILLSILLYIALGLWICFKRDWYEAWNDSQGEQIWYCMFAVLFTPLNLIIVLFKEFLIRDWYN